MNMRSGLKRTFLVIPVVIAGAAMLAASFACAADPTWTTKTVMPSPRGMLGGATMGVTIYAIGGFDGAIHRDIVHAYNTETNTWKAVASLPSARATDAIAVNGKVYAIGGYAGTNPINNLDCYNPITDTWTSPNTLSVGKYELGLGSVDGKIYVIGGSTSGSVRIDTVEEYDTFTNTWRTRAPLPTPRGNLAVAVVGRKIYAIGGMLKSAALSTTVEVFDPDTNTWEAKKNMPTSRWALGAVAINGTIYAVGGEGGYLSTVEAYDTTKDIWWVATNMPTARSEFILQAVNGKLYAIAGHNGAGSYTGVNEMGVLGKLASSMEVFPCPPLSGQTTSVRFGVTNGLTNAVTGLTPSSLQFQTGSCLVSGISGPFPAGPVDLVTGGSAVFTWTFSVSTTGGVVFTAGASGIDSGSKGAVSVSDTYTNGTANSCSVGSSLSSSLTTVLPGQTMTVRLGVSNGLLSQLNGVTPSILFTTGNCNAVNRTGPIPAGPVTIAAGGSQEFVWTFTVSTTGALAFVAKAEGTDSGTGGLVVVSETFSQAGSDPCASPPVPVVTPPPAPASAVEMYVYPHPLKCPGGNAVFKMDKQGTATLRILNMRGQVEKEITATLAASNTAQVFINCNDVKNGAYLLKGELTFTDGTSKQLKPFKFVVAGKR